MKDGIRIKAGSNLGLETDLFLGRRLHTEWNDLALYSFYMKPMVPKREHRVTKAIRNAMLCFGQRRHSSAHVKRMKTWFLRCFNIFLYEIVYESK